MGNAVISGILFQPPLPPYPLWFNNTSSSTTTTTATDTTLRLTDRERESHEAMKRTLIKNSRYNISISYLWLYSSLNDHISVSEVGSGEKKERWNLIPAIHITHNSSSGGGEDDNASIRLNRSNANSNNASTTSNSKETRSSFSSSSSSKYTLLYSHGNAEDLGLTASFLCDLARLLQIDILCYDYSGYGVSMDEAYVSEFYLKFGKEVREWQEWRVVNCYNATTKSQSQQQQEGGGGGGGDDNVAALGGKMTTRYGQVCHFAIDIFVAPMFHPHDNDGSVPSTTTVLLQRQQLLSRFAWTTPTSSEIDCYSNIAAAHSYLTKVACVPYQNVLLYGKSVGSGPSCWLAQKLCRHASTSSSSGTTSRDDEDGDDYFWGMSCQNAMCNSVMVDSRDEESSTDLLRPTSSGGRRSPPPSSSMAPGGVVLHSPFLSVIRVVLDVGFTPIGDLFPNVDRLGDFTCPVYIIHGSNDSIVPFYHGQTLFQTLPDTTKCVPFWAQGAGHNNIEKDMSTAYIKRLLQFIRQCHRLSQPSPRVSKQQLQHQHNLQLQMQMQMRHQQQQTQAQLQQTTQAEDFLATLRQSMVSKDGDRADVLHDPITIARRQGSEGYARATSMPPLTTQSSMGISSSKQRKQKGTLVMRSTHNHPNVSSAPSSTSSVIPPLTVGQQQLNTRQSSLADTNKNNMMFVNNQFIKVPSVHPMTTRHRQDNNLQYDRLSANNTSMLVDPSSQPLQQQQQQRTAAAKQRRAHNQQLFKQRQMQYQLRQQLLEQQYQIQQEQHQYRQNKLKAK